MNTPDPGKGYRLLEEGEIILASDEWFQSLDRGWEKDGSGVDAQKTAERSGWIRLSQGRYRVEKHFCKECADKPLPTKRRTKETLEK